MSTDASRATPGAVILQHETNAPAALLADWAAARGIATTVVRADGDAPLPDPVAYDFAVSLGSEASADDDRAWVRRELEWLRAADADDIPVLGICFGSQALATALGGAVARAARPELGWVEIDTDDAQLVAPGPWAAWHHDVLTVPADGTELARNAVGPQAFRIRRHLGVQFHPEATPAIVEGWAAEPGGQRDMRGARRDLATLRADGARAADAAARNAWALFDGFLARAGLAAAAD